MAKNACTVIARSLICLASLVSLIIVLTDNVTAEYGDFTIEATYADWGSLQYFVAVNAIICVYSGLVLLLPSGSLLWRLVAAVDVVILTFIGSGGGVAWTQYANMVMGSPQASWPQYCICISAFCNRVLGALVAYSIGGLIHCALTLISIHVAINPLLLNNP